MKTISYFFLIAIFLSLSINIKAQEINNVFNFPPQSLKEKIFSVDSFYYENKLVFTYYDSIGHTLFGMQYYPNGNLSQYYLLQDVRYFAKYALENISWSIEGILQTYTIAGPGVYEFTYVRDSLGSISIYDIDPRGIGLGLKYDLNGYMQQKIIFTPREDSVTQYYLNGKIHKQYKIYYETYVGEYLSFDSLGNIDTLGNYLSFNQMETLGKLGRDVKGIKNGKWEYYSEGLLLKTEIWQMDTLVSLQENKKTKPKKKI